MKEVLKYGTSWLMRMIFVLLSFFVFQSSIVAVAATPIILEQSHHAGILQVYTYDEIESSVWIEVDRTAWLSREPRSA